MEKQGLASDPISQFRAKQELFTPSNAISALRAVMVVPAMIAVMDGLGMLAATIFIVAFASDLLDGYIARATNDVSEYGKIIDPLADKIFVGGVVLAMMLAGMLPVWFVVTILARDAIIFVTGLWASRKLGVVLPSNYTGKAAVFTISLTLFLTVLGASEGVLVFCRYMSLALMLISLAAYGKRLYSLLSRTTAGV